MHQHELCRCLVCRRGGRACHADAAAVDGSHTAHARFASGAGACLAPGATLACWVANSQQACPGTCTRPRHPRAGARGGGEGLFRRVVPTRVRHGGAVHPGRRSRPSCRPRVTQRVWVPPGLHTRPRLPSDPGGFHDVRERACGGAAVGGGTVCATGTTLSCQVFGAWPPGV